MSAPPPDFTYGQAVGEMRVGCVATGWAVGLQDAVIQEVPRLLCREGGAFALHYTELTHHAGKLEREKFKTPLMSSNRSSWILIFPLRLCLINKL